METKKSENLFILGIILTFYSSIFGSSIIFSKYEILKFIMLFWGYVCFVIKIFFDRYYSLKEIIIYSFLFVLGLTSYINTSNTVFLTTIIIIISMKGINIDKVIKILFINISIFIIIHVLYYVILLFFDKTNLNIVNRNLVDGDVIHRYTFGFNHPNVFGMYVFWSIAMYCYLSYNKLSKANYFVIFLVAIFVYVFPNSKTSFLSILILEITILLRKKNILKFKKLNYFFIISVFVLIFIIFNVHSKPVIVLNNLLSTRIYIGYIIYINYGIKLFGYRLIGTPTIFLNGSYYTSISNIDSVYYSLLLNYGIVIFIVMILLIYLTIKILIKKDKEKEEVFIFIWILYAISETICLYPFIGFPILFISELFKEKLWKKVN